MRLSSALSSLLRILFCLLGFSRGSPTGRYVPAHVHVLVLVRARPNKDDVEALSLPASSQPGGQLVVGARVSEDHRTVRCDP